MRRSLLALLLALVPLSARAQVNSSTPGWFPFTVPGLDTSVTPIDLSGLNEKPAGKNGFVRVQGAILTDGAGKRLKLFGVNMTAHSAFPAKTDAPAVARRLAKLGFNIVRLHQMDWNDTFNNQLLNNPDNGSFNATNLDKLDFFINELKKNGIYVNLNLHVTRTYPGTPSGYDFSKGLDHFHNPYINSLKQFSSDLLNHVNPYSGLAYKNEPAIAVIEVNNENTVQQYDFSTLGEPFATSLRTKWIDWLKTLYPTTASLQAAWGIYDPSFSGPNLVGNPSFTGNGTGWFLDSQGGAAATLASLSGEPGGRWTTTAQGTLDWHLQLTYGGLNPTEGKAYRIRFDAKSNASRNMGLYAALNQPPWSAISWYYTSALTTAWQTFSYEFVATGTVPNVNRVTFSANNQLGQFDLRNVALQEISSGALLATETYESNNIPFMMNSRSAVAKRDWYKFLAALEKSHALDMRGYLKNTVGAQQLIYQSQMIFGGMPALIRESVSDLADSHTYWQHPQFPGTPWDPVNWTIANTSQLAQQSGGEIAHLALQRIAGKPYTVSEYNNAAPSDYAAETVPTLAALGAIQDWDGVYFFDYASFTTDLNSNRIRSFFFMQGHPGQTALVPLSALMFRRGLLSPALQTVTLTASEPRIIADREANGIFSQWGSFDRFWGQVSLPRNVALKHRVEVASVSADQNTSVNFAPTLTAPSVSDNGQLTWDAANATLKVNAPQLRLALGRIGNKTTALGDVSIATGSMAPSGGNEHAHIGLVALDGKPLSQSKKALLVALGRAENQNMGWNAGRTSVGSNWGTGPAIVQGVTATVTMPNGGWRVERLTPTGAVTGGAVATGVASFSLAPSHQTVWYLLTRSAIPNGPVGIGGGLQEESGPKGR